MRKSDKKILIFMSCLLVIFFVSVGYLVHTYEQLGGAKGIAIEIGKGIREVQREVDRQQSLP